MHPKLVKEAAKDRLFFNTEKRLLSNGHWLIDLARWHCDVGFRQPAEIPADIGPEIRIDPDGKVSQGPATAHVWDSETGHDPDEWRKVDLNPVRVNLREAHASTVASLDGSPILTVKDHGQIVGIVVSAVVLATEPDETGNTIEIGLNPEYYAAIRLCGLSLYARDALSACLIKSKDYPVGLVMPQRI